MDVVEIGSPFVRARVSPTAAMVLDAAFEVAGGTAHPLARAPWLGDDGLEAHPGHLRQLGGDFVGLPFGSAGAPADLSPIWQGLIPAAAPEPAHGLAADADWRVTARGDDFVTLRLAYPQDHDLESVERTIRARSDSAELDFELTLRARRSTRVPVGLHPILRLPAGAQQLHLTVDFERGYTYPGIVPPGAGVAKPGSQFATLDAVPAREDGTVDLSSLPLADSTGRSLEDIVLLAGVRGPLRAQFDDDGTVVVLDWDRELIPSLMLWISDRALDDAPFDSRYRALGTEPIAAAFDFAPVTSVTPNPLSTAGYPTVVLLHPTTPVTIRHSIAVSSAGPYV